VSPVRRGEGVAGLIASSIRFPALLLAVALVYGTVGYMLIEHFTLLDALYMTATTLTTVGFGEINAPLSPAGRWFTLSLMAFGVGAVFILIGSFTAVLATGELGIKVKRRKMRRRIEALDGHYIICAYGRVGRSAAEELIRQGAEVVVIDVKDDLEPLMQEDDVPYIIGDPADDDVLELAGLHRAKALICAVDSDEVNVYITLSARSLNPGLFIVSRASRPESIDKLERAGSNRVVSPYGLSGIRMASLSMQPAMIEFVDMISVAPDLRIEELRVGPTSPYVGRSVKDICEPYGGITLLALRRAAGDVLIPPKADSELAEGDVVIAVGPVAALSDLAAGAR
jgi:voltage-gated potassium channel